MQIIISKRNDRWVATFNTGEQSPYPLSAKAGDIARHVKQVFPQAEIGIKASDLGPYVAKACLVRGDGNTLWLK